MQCLSLRSVPVLDPGAKPLEPFGERLECSEGGSTGRRTNRVLPAHQPAVRSAPNQDRWSAWFIGGFREKARQNKATAFAGWTSGGTRSQVTALQEVGELYGEIGALAELASGVGILTIGVPHLFERLEQ